jgi:hypothetical protein
MAEINALEKVYELTKEEFERILEIGTDHVHRATNIVSFGGVILSIVFYLYAEGYLFAPVFALGALCLGGSLAFSFFVIRQWEFKQPKMSLLAVEYQNRAYCEVLRKFISLFLRATKENKNKVGLRGDIVDYSLLLMFLGLFFVILSVFIN